jgi:hypothetical protein
MHTTDHMPELVGYHCRAINYPTCLALPFCIAITTSSVVAVKNFRNESRKQLWAAILDRFNKEDEIYVGTFLFTYLLGRLHSS